MTRSPLVSPNLMSIDGFHNEKGRSSLSMGKGSEAERPFRRRPLVVANFPFQGRVVSMDNGTMTRGLTLWKVRERLPSNPQGWGIWIRDGAIVPTAWRNGAIVAIRWLSKSKDGSERRFNRCNGDEECDGFGFPGGDNPVDGSGRRKVDDSDCGILGME